MTGCRARRASRATPEGCGLGMLINEQMARQYWPNESPLGARIRTDRAVYEVVGIVGDVRERHLSEPPKAMVYRVGPQTLPMNVLRDE